MRQITKKQQEYLRYAAQKKPKPPYIKNILMAFLVGGSICTIGQFFQNFYISYGINIKQARVLSSVTMIFLGAFLTGIGIYDEIGKKAGAGSIVPITGFANSIVSPAMEFKREGYVLGVGSKMFVIAGPVLVYGITTSLLVGLIYYLLKL